MSCYTNLALPPPAQVALCGQSAVCYQRLNTLDDEIVGIFASCEVVTDALRSLADHLRKTLPERRYVVGTTSATFRHELRTTVIIASSIVESLTTPNEN